MTTPTLVVRADGGPDIGIGHLMRALALAEGWREAGGDCHLVTASVPERMRDRWAAAGARVVGIDAPPGSPGDLAASLSAAASMRASWFLLDGYRFGPSWQDAARDQGMRVAWVDDLGHPGPLAADLVVNPNPHAGAGMYPGLRKGARLLLGPRFAPMRREFADAAGPRPSGAPEEVLVALGGADAGNAAEQVLRALDRLDRPLRVTLLVGAANPHAASLRAAAQASPHEVEVVSDPPRVAEVASRASVAVAAGGTTCWELALLGVPMVLLSTAPNQRPNCAWLAAHGAALDVGDAAGPFAGPLARSVAGLLQDAARRSALAAAARALVDGEGAARVVMAMRGDPVRLRRARPADSAGLLAWANNPEVRAASFNPRPITPEEHARWFGAKLADPGVHLFIALDAEDRPVGQVRFEVVGREAEVHVAIAGAARGRGAGSAALRLGTARVLRDLALEAVHAHVKPGNERSRRAFERAGYKLAGLVSVKGTEALHLVAYP